MSLKHNKLLLLVLAIIIAVMCVLAASADARAETKDGIPVILIESGPESAETENPYQAIKISEDEMNELRWVLALEAQGEGLNGEVACCEVIFNRVLSANDWGSGVHGVLTMKGQFATYRYIGSRKAWAVPGELEDAAIAQCLTDGPTILPDMGYVYFDTGRRNGKRNIKRGNHWFGAES